MKIGKFDIGYRHLKHVTVMLQVFSIPFGVYAGAMLALDEPMFFMLGITISMIFAFTQAHIWWLTMEHIEKPEKSIEAKIVEKIKYEIELSNTPLEGARRQHILRQHGWLAALTGNEVEAKRLLGHDYKEKL